MKRFHIALAVASLEQSIADYTQRLGQEPTAVVPGAYAMWRTDLLNFSINESPAQAGLLRHIGFEDDTAAGFAKTRDVNGIEWEQFSPGEQDRRIEETYGTAIRQTGNR
ncbi:catechol 2,3-dioxygenase-like lactoylglutathione lyase family enzyme [Caballeronia udeis]|uniref:Catechol 2,3-dioxygenase-like lactoylglutathione lyase family enzyme n=1 Tax=Caballeronia udeis TaxID=1232866 RepID=A0ABW8MJ78_9BURK